MLNTNSSTCGLVMVRRSLRSAPAQKTPFTLLLMIITLTLLLTGDSDKKKQILGLRIVSDCGYGFGEEG